MSLNPHMQTEEKKEDDIVILLKKISEQLDAIAGLLDSIDDTVRGIG